ncbi:hypothetical protein [Streptomyces sp. NPDC057910]|uniref:hypothetical protein n=1 Tax=Streptomyces sp. NPDC057910 TaxID=3346278 RepID=UPI001DEA0A74|nr:hypothetical protein [Streptomyces sp. MAG02]
MRSLFRSHGRHRATASDLAPVAALIAAGEADANDSAWCTEEARTTYHAMHADGSRTCWTCNTTTPKGS